MPSVFPRSPRQLTLPQPPAVMLPLKDYAGGFCRCLVKKGQCVLLGQCIALPENAGAAVHASVSGTVRAVSQSAVVIENDFRNTPAPDLPPTVLPDRETLSHRIAVSGLLSAEAVPLLPHMPCKTLVLSLLPRDQGEPDPMTLYTAEQVFGGLRLAKQLWSPSRTVILRDRRNPTAGVLAKSFGDGAEILAADGRYPGGEPQTLRRRLCGFTAKQPELLLLDAHGAAGIFEAVYLGQPLIRRQLIVAGNSRPVAVSVPLGTAVGYILTAAGFSSNDSRPVGKADRLVLPPTGR